MRIVPPAVNHRSVAASFKEFQTQAAAIGRPSYFLFQACFHREMKQNRFKEF